MRKRRENLRIEGTFTFPAPVERVFAAVVDPDVLRQVIPGCERLIQLGPADEEGALTCEARLRLGPGGDLYTGRGTIERLRRPTHLTVQGRGQGPHGPVTLRGSLDLVGQDERTVAAYVWDVGAGERVDDGQDDLDEGAAARYMQALCERLAAALRAERPDGQSLADALPVLRADTARGRIILLPSEPPDTSLTARVRPVARGVAWAAAGLVVGLVAIAAAASILRHWGARHDEGGAT